MASAIYILDHQLNPLIQRQYKHDLDSQSVIDTFKKAVSNHPNSTQPVVAYRDVHFVHMRYDDVYLVCPVLGDVDVMCLMTFLSKLGELLRLYLVEGPAKTIATSVGGPISGGHRDRIDSDKIKDNYILIYELFDEILDFGIPQLTEYSILKEYIKSTAAISDTTADSVAEEPPEINSSIPRTSTNKISWRPKGIFYNKNEIFINFKETLKFRYSYKEERVMTNVITGEIDCRCYLSGMPELKLGLNEPLDEPIENKDSPSSVFTHLSFHQCVTLSEIKNSISFVPPDGHFRLFSYQIANTTSLYPLLMVRPKYKIYKKKGKYRLRVKVKLSTHFKRKFSLREVKINVPLKVAVKQLVINFNEPLKFKTKMGSVIHNLERHCMTWRIPRLDGNSEGEMMSEFELLPFWEVENAHEDNVYHNKQDKNDLIYFELSREMNKIDEEERSRAEQPQRAGQRALQMVTAEFELNSTLYSDLKVNYLKIDEPQFKFQSFPWVRYGVFCRGDDYCFSLCGEMFVVELEEEDLESLSKSPSEARGFDGVISEVTSETASEARRFSESFIVEEVATGEDEAAAARTSFEEYVVDGEGGGVYEAIETSEMTGEMSEMTGESMKSERQLITK